MADLSELLARSARPADFVRSYFDHLKGLIDRIDPVVIEEIINELAAICERGSTMYVIANGGSAATATHMVNDWSFAIRKNSGPYYRIISLCDNPAVLTALANDLSFEDVFKEQLKVYLDPTDVVLAMSVSGDSENVIRAVEYARKRGSKVIGCYGFGGGRLKGLSDIGLHVPSLPGEYGPTEDLFQILDHVVYSYFRFQSKAELGGA